MNYAKGKLDVYQSESVRLSVLRNNPLVDEVFLEESMDEKTNYIRNYKADLLVMGDDWINCFDNLGCKTLYLPRTPHISSTLLRTHMATKKKNTS
jgi:glycerol-3-phosphate cytidylyltransferase-like family protein